MKKITLFLLLSCFFFYTCTTKKFNNKVDLWGYIKEKKNGYFQTKNVNGYEFSLLIKPTDLLVSQEIGNNTSNKNEIEQLRKKYKKNIYFTLSISGKNKELLSITPKNRQDFGVMVNQLVFGMREKVHVFSQQKDTLEMLDYVYPRMYGMSKATTMLFVYPKDYKFLKGKYLNFTIEDLGTYTGEVKFKIPIKNIILEPKLEFKKL